MSGKSVLALAVVLIMLAASWFGLIYFEVDRAVEKVIAKRLFDFPSKAITTIRIDRPGVPAVVVRQTGEGAWAFEQPYEHIIPRIGVLDRIAAAGAMLLGERVVDEHPESLEPYGLDEPALTFTIATADAEYTVHFGEMDPTERYYYARRDGEQAVFLLADKLFRELDRPLEAMRYPYALEVGEKDVTRLEYVRIREKEGPEEGETYDESVSMTVEKDAQGKWRMVEPSRAAADQERVANLVKEVQFSPVREHIDDPEDLAPYGLLVPQARLTLTTAEGEKHTLLLGMFDNEADEGGLFARRQGHPSVLRIDGHVLSLLPRTPTSFRERRLLTHPLNEVRRVDYVRDGVRIVIERDPDAGWRVTEPARPDYGQVEISDFLTVLKGIRGLRFPGVEAPHYGLDEPEIGITLTLADRDERPVIRIGAPTPLPQQGFHYAQQDSGVVVTIREQDADALRIEPFDLREKQLLNFPRTRAKLVRIQLDGDRYVFLREDGEWRVVEPGNARLEQQSDMQTLIHAAAEAVILGMEAADTPADPADYGLDEPVLVMTIQYDADGDSVAQAGPVTVGAPVAADAVERYATILGRPGVFRVSQDVVSGARESLRGLRRAR